MKRHDRIGLAAALLTALLWLCVTAGAETVVDSVEIGAETAAPHIHRWRYEAEGSAITAYCEGEGVCDVTEGLTLVISAPGSPVYDGKGKAASLKYGYSPEAFGGEHPIRYASEDSAVTSIPPADAGDYVASVAPGMGLNEPRASVAFTIAKADLDVVQQPGPVEATYDGEAHALMEIPESLPEGCAGLEYSLDGGVSWSDELPVAVEAGTYYVKARFVGDGNHNDFEAEPLTSTIVKAPAGLVLATMTAQGEDALKLTWTEAKYVDGYDVVYKNVKDRSRNYTLISVEGTETTLTKLAAYNCYKARVRAWVMKGGEKRYVLDASPVVYAITGGYARGVVNPGSLSLTKHNVTVKIDRKLRIGGSVKGVKKGTLLSRVPRIRYISSDTEVATVDRKGDVTGVGPGSCEIYAVTNNGLWESVKVTVDASPDSVWFTKKRGSLKVGGKAELTKWLKLWPGRSQTELTWTSADAGIAAVDETGVVTGVKKGETTVTVTASNGKSARVKVRVKD